MGVNLTLPKQILALDDLRRSFAVGAFVVLYPFLVYTEGINGISLNTALKLIHKYGCLEDIPDEYQDQLPEDHEAIRNHFTEPEITDTYTYPDGELDESGLLNFLCDEQGFSKIRVETLVKRKRTVGSRKSLTQWMWC